MEFYWFISLNNDIGQYYMLEIILWKGKKMTTMDRHY